MNNNLYSYLAEWNESTTDRQKAQYAYSIGGVALLIVAGLVGLVNNSLGLLLANIALASIAIFFINGVVWALLYVFVLLKITKKQAPKSKKR